MKEAEVLQELKRKLLDNPNILFDEAVSTPSVNNNIKEFWKGEPVWEDMSDEDLSLEDLSEVDASNVLWEINRQLEKDERLMSVCMGH